MFRLRSTPTDDPPHLRWEPTGRYRSGASWIEPFTHPVLEHGAIVRRSDQQAVIVNRERQRAVRTWCHTPGPHVVDDAVYEQRLAEVRSWPLAHTLVHVDRGGLRVEASRWGAAPMHLAEVDGELRGSWDLLDLAPLIDTCRLNELEVVRFLTYATHYSAQTLLADVITVTERATAAHDARGLRITYPAPGLHAQPRTLKPGADPVGFFEHALAEVVQRWDVDPDAAVADVSGGMDSANVAVTLAQLHPGRVATGAMMLVGPYREQQARRRRELLADGFAEDHRLEMIAQLPFAPGGPRDRGEPFDPQEGPYAEARNLLLDRYAAAGKRVVFTGLGGDEMMKLRRAEAAALGLAAQAPPLRATEDGVPVFLGERGRALLPRRFDGLAPIGPTLWSILDCFSALYPHYMKRGLWPINPLAAPSIVRLAESLAAPWRAKKHLLRERLRHRGFSTDVVHPELPENFQHILDLAMRRHGAALLEHLVDEGARLVADGYLDETELRRAARTFAVTGRRTFDVYRPLMLEMALRSLTR
ncbi:hypothetical protein [Marinitenerispora sediminis]|uniref:Asparagine synthase n=1 Tax=Marinitenerispora sediminis TaxID=1931232 RepID=A0A368SYB5_9ACTN|nr:hypothetical protein [Marinitenerispora sediminis]RCV48063.1 hypothetical protein DEF23_25650 [Marinitenerispora sediminis]RCV49043.1 hypothetical protein DEF24_25635 [Marinitenerispora sediminis]RCV57754.1 hypothetical protein DEF28_00880 [Marinitenerispora sediminis]